MRRQKNITVDRTKLASNIRSETYRDLCLVCPGRGEISPFVDEAIAEKIQRVRDLSARTG